ncbi:hypothetical protein Peur_024308 [Populus x canadensis]
MSTDFKVEANADHNPVIPTRITCNFAFFMADGTLGGIRLHILRALQRHVFLVNSALRHSRFDPFPRYLPHFLRGGASSPSVRRTKQNEFSKRKILCNIYHFMFHITFLIRVQNLSILNQVVN